MTRLSLCLPRATPSYLPMGSALSQMDKGAYEGFVRVGISTSLHACSGWVAKPSSAICQHIDFLQVNLTYCSTLKSALLSKRSWLPHHIFCIWSI